MNDERNAPTIAPRRPPETGGMGDCGTWPPSHDVHVPPPPSRSGTPDGGRFGDYELLEEIARGGMGVVYKARQTSLQRVVALKMILNGHLAGDEDVRRFHVEAAAAARLDHPSIVPIYEIGVHEGQHYYSMAYVEGESLADLLRDGPLPPRESAEAVSGAAKAIDYAHRHAVVHRDLKPGNILLDGRGTPRIIDFGLAKELARDASLTGAGQVLGTPSYMAPEQAAGKTDQIGPAADIYALGAILYALVTGRPPFVAAGTLDTMLQVLEQVPVSPRLLNRAVPRDLETIVLKCLEKSAVRRYRTAGELAGDLDRFLEGKPIRAKPPGLGLRLARWSREHLLVTSVSSVTAFAMTVAGLISAYHYRQELLLNSSLRDQAAEMEQSVLQERALARQERQRRTEAERRAQRGRALWLLAEARLAMSESPDLGVLLAAEAIDTAGAGTAAGDASWRDVLEAALAEYETRQPAADSETPAANRRRADLSLPALVALARRRVGRSWTTQERRQYALYEREEPP
jgi:serine/threonine protein kinase